MDYYRNPISHRQSRAVKHAASQIKQRKALRQHEKFARIVDRIISVADLSPAQVDAIANTAADAISVEIGGYDGRGPNIVAEAIMDTLAEMSEAYNEAMMADDDDEY